MLHFVSRDHTGRHEVDLDSVLALRDHRVDHGRQTSKTVQAWADRLEDGLNEHLVLRRELVDRELLNWLERKGESLAQAASRRRLIEQATRVFASLDTPTSSTCQ